MDSDLLATCNALGSLEEERYFKDPDCLDTVKCLIKFLHQEDNHDVRMQLGAVRIVKNDLLPILQYYHNDEALCSAVLRLLVNLTQPALLCFGNKVPKEADQYHNYLDILALNVSYKQEFSNVEIWKVLAQKVYDIFNKDWEDRLPDDTLTVERILVLCRNILHISSPKDEQQTDYVSLQDKLIIAMHNAGVDSMLLYLASSTTEQRWCLHVAEIIALLLKDENPSELAKFNASQPAPRIDKELEAIKARECERNKANRLHLSSRHSRFGGTYVARGMPALADANDLVIHKSLHKCDSISFDDGKSKLRKAKNRRPLSEGNAKRKASRDVCQIMRDFCAKMLESGYNHFMFSIRDKVSRERSDDHDETYYFTIMSFLMEFNRKYRFNVDRVSETIQIATLHFIDVSMTNCLELMATDKQECVTWGRRMHCALKCYKEFLLTVHSMLSSDNEQFGESAKVLLNNVFYTHEYREVFATLLQKYDESKLSHGYLADLIETTHLFTRLFEKHCKGSAVIVEKTRKVKRKPKKRDGDRGASEISPTEEERRSLWDEIEDAAKASARSESLPEAGSPLELFDPTSGAGEEEQQKRALKRIQRMLHAREVPGSVATLRQARHLWPEIDVFGTRESTWEDDVVLLKEYCVTDMSNIANDDPSSLAQEDGDDEEEEEVIRESAKEVEYNFNDYLKKFAVAKVIQAYSVLLAKFESNTREINHYVAKMFHRVGYDIKMYGLMFQASIFRVFQKVFKAVKTNPALRELAVFGKFLIRKFFEILPTNDKLVVELLFWKQNAAQVYELAEGYGTFSKSNAGAKKQWSEAEQDELKQLYLEFKDAENDVVDNIMTRITDETRTRHQIVRQLVILGLVENASVLKRKKGTKIAVWREHEEMELRTLFEEFKDSEDPVGSIMAMMSVKRSKSKVIEKIVELGLVVDRKALHKKRKRIVGKSGRNQEIVHAGGSDSSGEDVGAEHRRSESESDEDDETWSLIDIRSCVRQAARDGTTEQIGWVKSNLEQAIEDRNQTDADVDGVEPLPLVPLTEEQENAMQTAAFKKLLFFVGLHKPVAGQEMFWRIPSTLSVLQLRDCVDALSDATAAAPDDDGETSFENRPLTSRDVPEDVGALRTKRKRVLADDGDASGNDDEDRDSETKRQKRLAEGEDIASTSVEGRDSTSRNPDRTAVSRKRMLLDDSESSDSDREIVKPLLSDRNQHTDTVNPKLGDDNSSLDNKVLMEDEDATKIIGENEDTTGRQTRLEQDKDIAASHTSNTSVSAASVARKKIILDDSDSSDDSDKENAKSFSTDMDTRDVKHQPGHATRKKRMIISDDED